MDGFVNLLVEHGYLLLGLWVLADKSGLPVPALPGLVGAGILSGTGDLELAAVVALSTAVALAADFVWFLIGRRTGKSLLAALCKWSLEPDSCVRSAAVTLERLGPSTLVVCGFVPGLQTVIPPMAGMAGVPAAAFAGLRLVGNLLWVLVFVLPGYLLADQAEVALQGFQAAASVVLVAVAGGLVLWVACKWTRRQLFLHAVRRGAIQPGELQAELHGGNRLLQVVDLRDPADIREFPFVIPQAQVIPLEDLDAHAERLLQRPEIVLYCT